MILHPQQHAQRLVQMQVRRCLHRQYVIETPFDGYTFLPCTRHVSTHTYYPTPRTSRPRPRCLTMRLLGGPLARCGTAHLQSSETSMRGQAQAYAVFLSSYSTSVDCCSVSCRVSTRRTPLTAIPPAFAPASALRWLSLARGAWLS